MLCQLNTHPNIVEDMSAGIHKWQLQLSTPNMLTMAGQQQMALSWNNFAHGFIHRSWQTTQGIYYTQNKSWKSAHKWATTVLHQILKIAHGQWDHRNEALHKSNTQLVLDASANIEIHAQYDLGTANLPLTSRHLLHTPRLTTLNLNHCKKLQWIASLKAAR